MIRKLFIIALCLSFMAMLAVPSYAARGDRETLNYGYVKSGVASSDSAIVSVPSYVYAVTWYSTSSNGYVNLYDSTDGTGNLKVEVAEATSGDSIRVEFDIPILFNTAVYADVQTGVAVVEYR